MKIYRRLPVALLLALFFLIPAVAQETDALIESGGTLTGKITDAATGNPLSFVNVYLDSLKIGSSTDGNGEFVIRLIPPGRYRLIAEYIGYETIREEDVQIISGRLTSRSLSLVPSEVEGQEVLITATRKPQTAQMAPASIVVLKARELENRPVTTFDQALESVPGLSVHRAAGISVQSLSIRGSSDVAGGGVGNRILLMVDGRPALTSDAGGAFWALVPTNFIDRIEVVKGAFSSLYGSTAMGGVVNVITSRPTYHSQGNLKFQYGFFENPVSNQQYTEDLRLQSRMEANYSGANGRFSYLFSASRQSSDGHSEQAAYTFYNLYGKFFYNLNNTRNLEVTLGGGSAENDYPHAWLNTNQPLRVRSKYRDDLQDKQQFNLDIHYWAVPNHRSKYSSRFYYYRTDATSQFNPDDPDLLIPGNEPFGLETNSIGDKFGNITQFDMAIGDRNYLITGIDMQIDKVASSPDSILYGRQQVNNFAVYAQNELKLHSKFTTTLGLRFDHNHLIAGKTISEFSPKVSFLYTPTPEVSWRVLFGQAFRAPTIAERFFKVELGGGILFLQNPDLDAEQMNFSFESGLRWRIHRNIDFDIAYYRYQYRDLIYWVDITQEFNVSFPYFQVRNLNEALTQGIETTITARWSNWFRGFLNYTYLNAKDLSEDRLDDVLAYRPEHSFYASGDFNWNRFTLHLNGRYRSDIEEVFLFPLQAPEAFTVFNSKLRVSLANSVDLSLSINNLLNSEYEELARYRMPMRNWMLGAAYRF